MSEPDQIEHQIAQTMDLLREKLGAGGRDLNAALSKAGHRLPRRIRQQARKLAQAEPLASHPKLRRTLDAAGLSSAAHEVRAHLKTIDLADRRKGWWLGMLGGLAFNMLLALVLVVVFLRWQGFV